jgi:methyltransferase (TIGR00027 family)
MLVFEVDHPATQAQKLQRFRDLGLEQPASAIFVSVDLEQDPLIDALIAAGFDRRSSAFFSWLGVTNYLGPQTIFETLKTLAALPGAIELVLDYVLPNDLLDPAGQRLVATLLADMGARGEPGRSFFSPTELIAKVTELGFAEAFDVGPEVANARYFAGRHDELRLPEPCPGHLLYARNR